MPEHPTDLNFGFIIQNWFRDQYDLKFLSRCCSSPTAVMFIKTGDVNTQHVAAVVSSKFFIKLNHTDDLWSCGVDLDIADPKYFEKLHDHLNKLRDYEPQR